MNIYFKIRLWFKKRYALQEVRTDISYIEKYKHTILTFNERKARGDLQGLRQKEERTAVEDLEVEKLSRQIADHVSLKKEYQDLKQLEGEIASYLSQIWKL